MSTPMICKEPCVPCLLNAIQKFHLELFAWLKAGGDERLLAFSALDAWGPVLEQSSAISHELKQSPQNKPH